MATFLLELAKLTIPGVLVLLAAYYILKDLLNNQERNRYYELKKETAKNLNPIRLTAYERLALFLERIQPDSMILRVQNNSMKVKDLHIALLATVREEFEHNVTQQIYVSNDVWAVTKNAKESIIQLINTCASDIPDELPAIELAKIIIERYGSIETTPVDMALEILKKEVKSFY
ncbi:MAG: hypothetical protein IJ916_00900 [Paludibacteraceae bacterium]|jgi:hypothetical protein|nr:hypothetical protein [Paludibacteraceae bacterium]MBR2260242.1 hypothetical protein [Paludibacteraceae bacterium]MEE3483822.1 hypothetical protein [Bacteroidales bacterium]